MLIKKLRNYHEPLLILTLSILIFSTIYNIYLLQGTARVVNYTGLVRGATQRVVKLEIVGSPDDRLIENLDDILAGLQNGGSKYELVKEKSTPKEKEAELKKVLDNGSGIRYNELIKNGIGN